MLFNTVNFFVFLATVLLLHYLAPRVLRKWILLAASYFFYMSWNPKFIALLLALTVTDYLAAFWIERSQDNESQHRRKVFLVLGLSANLGFLGFFKYYNFLGDNIGRLLHLAPHALALPIILPLGISFHTFQSMSYLVDVYRGEQEAIRNPLDYALFIAFFPQLVAGPIVRAREFFKDLYHWRAPVDEERLRGVLLLLTGLVKKMVFADRFAIVADSYFSNPGAHPGGMAAWTGAIAFALQIFFDFSGYTDMAIGMALLLGFHFPENFRRPYLAFSITDFWHRWHMTLSRWLRDYLYIPLGGNRYGAVEDLSQPHADHAAGRAVAWGELEFRGVGRLSRRAALDRKADRAPIFRTAAGVVALSASRGVHVRARNPGLGILSRREFRGEPLRAPPDVFVRFRDGNRGAGVADVPRRIFAAGCDHRRALESFKSSATQRLRLWGRDRGDAVLSRTVRRDGSQYSVRVFSVLGVRSQESECWRPSDSILTSDF